MSQTETITLLPLDSIAMDTRPLRQIRPISEEGVSKLIDESDPKNWDPIFVRPYPASEPYPNGEDGRAYQLIAGYHRLTAARRLDLSKIRAVVRKDVTDDKTFLVVALGSNMRHGQQMKRDDQIKVLRRLYEVEKMSLGDLAKVMGIPKGTLHNWLTSRDTNAGRSLSRNATAGQSPVEGARGVTVATISPDWNAAHHGEEQMVRKAGSATSDLLASVPGAQIAGADVAAWVEGLSPHERETRRQQTVTALTWLGNLHALLRNDEEDSHATSD